MNAGRLRDLEDLVYGRALPVGVKSRRNLSAAAHTMEMWSGGFTEQSFVDFARQVFQRTAAARGQDVEWNAFADEWIAAHPLPVEQTAGGAS